jgi:hypothetical protein
MESPNPHIPDVIPIPDEDVDMIDETEATYTADKASTFDHRGL